MPVSKITIVPAEEADLRSILELQHLAYLSEARLVNDFTIPPLMETLEDTRKQFATGVILKAVTAAGEIVGSVRGRADGETLHVGKLMVHPERQGQGIGGRLLREIEVVCPFPRYELFTSSKSERNIALYERAGYVRFAEKAVTPELIMVFLEKRVSREDTAVRRD